MSDYMKELERLLDAHERTLILHERGAAWAEEPMSTRAALLAHAAQADRAVSGVPDMADRISEALDASQDEDHTGCRAILKECLRLISPAEQEDHAEDTLDMVPTSTEVLMTQASADVLAERQRQIDAEGWTAGYDDNYTSCELASAASCYAGNAGGFVWSAGWPEKIWPWSRAWWKPSTPRRDLVKAGALIIAEIERLDRVSLRAMLAAAPAASAQADRDAPVKCTGCGWTGGVDKLVADHSIEAWSNTVCPKCGAWDMCEPLLVPQSAPVKLPYPDKIWVSPDGISYHSDDCIRTYGAAREAAGYARGRAEQQAVIDRLMLEHCPDEMTAEQRQTWAAAQAEKGGE